MDKKQCLSINTPSGREDTGANDASKQIRYGTQQTGSLQAWREGRLREAE